MCQCQNSVEISDFQRPDFGQNELCGILLNHRIRSSDPYIRHSSHSMHRRHSNDQHDVSSSCSNPEYLFKCDAVVRHNRQHAC